MQRPDRDRESGYTLVGLMVVVAVINVALAVAVMSTRTLGRRAREAELLWRGQQIANAIGCYEQANGGEPLARLEQLVDANCLRRVFRDPMASDGEWRVLRQQDVADGTVAALLGVEVGGDSLTAAGGSAVGAASLSSAAGRSGTPPGGAGGFGSGSLTLGQQRPAVTGWLWGCGLCRGPASRAVEPTAGGLSWGWRQRHRWRRLVLDRGVATRVWRQDQLWPVGVSRRAGGGDRRYDRPWCSIPRWARPDSTRPGVDAATIGPLRVSGRRGVGAAVETCEVPAAQLGVLVNGQEGPVFMIINFKHVYLCFAL